MDSDETAHYEHLDVQLSVEEIRCIFDDSERRVDSNEHPQHRFL